MHPRHGYLGCHLPPPVDMREYSWRWPEPSLAWILWQSSTTTSRHERVQLEVARAITGLVSPSQVKAVNADVQLPPISKGFQTTCLQKDNKCANFPLADDSHQTLVTPCREHLKRKARHNTQLF